MRAFPDKFPRLFEALILSSWSTARGYAVRPNRHQVAEAARRRLDSRRSLEGGRLRGGDLGAPLDSSLWLHNALRIRSSRAFAESLLLLHKRPRRVSGAQPVQCISRRRGAFSEFANIGCQHVRTQRRLHVFFFWSCR